MAIAQETTRPPYKTAREQVGPRRPAYRLVPFFFGDIQENVNTWKPGAWRAVGGYLFFSTDPVFLATLAPVRGLRLSDAASFIAEQRALPSDRLFLAAVQPHLIPTPDLSFIALHDEDETVNGIVKL